VAHTSAVTGGFDVKDNEFAASTRTRNDLIDDLIRAGLRGGVHTGAEAKTVVDDD
jgi:hypothetical protein